MAFGIYSETAGQSYVMSGLTSGKRFEMTKCADCGAEAAEDGIVMHQNQKTGKITDKKVCLPCLDKISRAHGRPLPPGTTCIVLADGKAD